MDKQPAVVFRNVGQMYFPQTRVECHYTVGPEHQWSSSDWIGIFQVGSSSVKQYHTYTWALVPEGYTEGTGVHCCVMFQASYLPRPSATEYEFLYVDKMGEVCARSRSFTFCAPKPLEELETLKEERDEEDGEEEELLLVIPRAQLLQSRLEECLQKEAQVQQTLDVTKKEMEKEREKSDEARTEWERERAAMKEEISELRDNMRHNYDTLKRMEGKHKDVKYSQENLSAELNKLMAEKAESQQRIKDLEEHTEVLSDREKDGDMELERLKDRVKKMSSQMKHDEEKRKSLQAENEAALVEFQGLQVRLEASEHEAESLRRELRELGTRQCHATTELHQARLQAAQLTLQLSEENLVLREERATWALEREAYKHATEIEKRKLQDLSCEVQRKEEWLQEERMEREKLEAELAGERDSNRELLGEAKRELQELKASLRKVQREREDEQRLRTETKANGESPPCVTPGSSSEEDEESSSDTQEVRRQQTAAAEGKCLNLSELVDPILSELADSPMW